MSTYIRMCTVALEQMNRKTLIVCIVGFRVHCLTSLFQQTVEHVRSLHTREKWHLEVDDESGGCTQLVRWC